MNYHSNLVNKNIFDWLNYHSDSVSKNHLLREKLNSNNSTKNVRISLKTKQSEVNNDYKQT